MRSLIITRILNKPNGIFYEDELTVALIDQLVHHSHLLMFKNK